VTDDFKPRGYPRLIPRIFTDDPGWSLSFVSVSGRKVK